MLRDDVAAAARMFTCATATAQPQPCVERSNSTRHGAVAQRVLLGVGAGDAWEATGNEKMENG